jgi:hypothetical protein
MKTSHSDEYGAAPYSWLLIFTIMEGSNLNKSKESRLVADGV